MRLLCSRRIVSNRKAVQNSRKEHQVCTIQQANIEALKMAGGSERAPSVVIIHCADFHQPQTEKYGQCTDGGHHWLRGERGNIQSQCGVAGGKQY